MAILVSAACVAVSVSFRLYEKDFWQHLAVGRAIWQLHRVPTVQLWTWPTYGSPDVNSSWGFETLLWPIWRLGGVWGLFFWRWITTFLVFGLAWASARSMGARGFSPLFVMVLCSLTFRQRAHIRPESLAAVLLALEIWILARWRLSAAGPPRAPGESSSLPGHGLMPGVALVAITWGWANCHLSYFLGLGLLAIHQLDAQLDARAKHPGAKPYAMRLWAVTAAAVAISFLNPFGWRALWQPFEFALFQRHEPIFRSIPELQALDLGVNLKNLLPLVLFGWPLLLVWRWRRVGLDRVETCLALGAIGFAFSAERFLGFAMVVAAPYLARDLDAWVRAHSWPSWTVPAWSRAVLSGAACVVVGIAEWSRSDLPLGIGIRMREYPVAACDFIAAHGIEGRGFNQFYLGGYLLHRFWPDRGWLPFMDIHQAGTPKDRYTYAFALQNPRAWRDLDDRYRFDYAVLRRLAYPGDQLLDILDADTSFARVFQDDAAALYVRRSGALAVIAESLAYRALPAGTQGMTAIGQAVATDPRIRSAVRRELEREVAESPYRAAALVRLGNLALLEGNGREAHERYAEAIRIDPFTPHAHERLGLLALAEGRPRDALRELALERRLSGRSPGYDLRVGQAYQMLGDRRRARSHYREEWRRDPGNQEALDSLRVVKRRIREHS
jgi:tetratricopeptide (TPR) repeat protein